MAKRKKAFTRINEEIEFYQNCRYLLNNARNLYQEYVSDVYTKGINACENCADLRYEF